MNQVAVKLGDDPCIEAGTVARISGGRFQVVTSRGDYEATRAVSCLVEPRVDDEALVATLPNGACFVLAVLTRSGAQDATLTVDGNLAIDLPDGALSARAAKGVELQSDEGLVMRSRRLAIGAEQADVSVDRMSYLGRLLKAEAGSIKAVVGALDTVAERATQRLKRAYRWVEEMDHLRTKRLDYQATEIANLRGRNIMITAEQVAKIDAGQIHLG